MMFNYSYLNIGNKCVNIENVFDWWLYKCTVFGTLIVVLCN